MFRIEGLERFFAIQYCTFPVALYLLHETNILSVLVGYEIVESYVQEEIMLILLG